MDIVLKGEKDGIATVSTIKALNMHFIYLAAHFGDSTVKKASLTDHMAT